MIPSAEIRELVARNPGQMTEAEYAKVYEEIEAAAPCRLLIFGAGRDTFLWLRANKGGETIVVDDNPGWLEMVQRDGVLKSSEFVLVKYWTRLADWRHCLDLGQELAMGELSHVGLVDVALVDGPHGEGRGAPGRMQPIYMASRLVRAGGTVLVHDVHRPCETVFGEHCLGAMTSKVHHLGVWHR